VRFEGTETPSLRRQKSEKADLKDRLTAAQQEKEELRTCKVCYDNIMDCVLQPCGHLTSCMKCGEDMRKKPLPCPICRKKIGGCLRIYWA